MLNVYNVDSYRELNDVYFELEEINLQIKYSTDEFYRKSDAENLVNYTNAIRIYKDSKNSKIFGIILNNLGKCSALFVNTLFFFFMQLFREYSCEKSEVLRSDHLF